MRRVSGIRTLMALGILVALVAALPVLSATSLKQLLPTSKTMPGWAAVAKTYEHCANPEELYLIYNGGDVEYIESGVQEAAQQTYKKSNSLVTVTVHRMPDWQKAKAFYLDKHTRMQKMQKFTDLKVDKAGFMATQYGQCFGWSWGKHYLMGFSTKGAAAADQAALKAFMASIAKTIQKSG